ncbi:MAG: hypothetical protein J6T41_06515 [Neisseriaceae bacterium]|nr:hypothetical protein [Neisseriaceae bacterium]
MKIKAEIIKQIVYFVYDKIVSGSLKKSCVSLRAVTKLRRGNPVLPLGKTNATGVVVIHYFRLPEK